MKLTKKKLIQAVKPGLEKLGYLYIKDSEKDFERLNAYKVKCQKYVGFENSWYIFGCLNPLSTTTVERKKNKYLKHKSGELNLTTLLFCFVLYLL